MLGVHECIPEPFSAVDFLEAYLSAVFKVPTRVAKYVKDITNRNPYSLTYIFLSLVHWVWSKFFP